jgi:hypothetical protein
MMVERFDYDILAGPKDLKADLSKCGMGVLGPSGKVAARLRRKEISIRWNKVSFLVWSFNVDYSNSTAEVCFLITN